MSADTAGHAGRAAKDDVGGLLADISRLRLRATVEAGRLMVRGPRSTDPMLVQTLLTRKNHVLAALLLPDADEWAAWEERAAIAEFDGGLSRPAAETQAWAELQDRRKSAAMSGVGPSS